MVRVRVRARARVRVRVRQDRRTGKATYFHDPAIPGLINTSM